MIYRNWSLSYLVFEESKKNGSVGNEPKNNDAPIEADQHILSSLGQSEIIVFLQTMILFKLWFLGAIL